MKVAAAILGSLIWLSGCGAADAREPQTLPSVKACFVASGEQHPVALEIAKTASERRTGLMGRIRLPENAGMLFSYPSERSPERGFWMHNTLIPLDIAFLDSEGVIVSIRHMLPCTSSKPGNCPTYPAGKFFWHAVEMNAGYFSAKGIDTGDRLEWPATGENCSR
jgi:hypothetical protein